jgi:hypothetical protein
MVNYLTGQSQIEELAGPEPSAELLAKIKALMERQSEEMLMKLLTNSRCTEAPKPRCRCHPGAIVHLPGCAAGLMVT